VEQFHGSEELFDQFVIEQRKQMFGKIGNQLTVRCGNWTLNDFHSSFNSLGPLVAARNHANDEQITTKERDHL